MTTSSFDRSRCTRISPSAVLDDRLDGKDLEWARDHLRRCEDCRERVEDFREMLLRVGRLPSASVGAAAMDEAYALSIPDRIRAEAGPRPYDVAPAPTGPTVLAPTDMPPPLRPEVTSVPDLLTELEREIFRDEPVQDHPTRLSPMPEAPYPTMAAPQEIQPEEIEAVRPAEPERTLSFYDRAPVEPEPTDAVLEPEVPVQAEPETLPASLREVPVDSHREAEPDEWTLLPEPDGWTQPVEPAHAESSRWDDLAPAASGRPVEEEPLLPFSPDAEVAKPVAPQKPDTAMRMAVGLGAAATVLLAAVLYEGGWVSKLITGKATAARVAATASVKPSVRPSASVQASITPSLSPSAAPTAPVLYTLGNGVTGVTMFRIRPGTANPAFTRLVFDMHGGGLPTMIVSRPDDLHVTVTFKDTNVAGAPVNGITSNRVAAVEPGVQQGQDGTITVDLKRPVRVVASTLPATAGYAWRLVLDLYTP
jgi:hypothetical protein